MGFSSNTGMSFRTRLRVNSPRAGIRCSANRSRSKHERVITIIHMTCLVKSGSFYFFSRNAQEFVNRTAMRGCDLGDLIREISMKETPLGCHRRAEERKQRFGPNIDRSEWAQRRAKVARFIE